MEVPKDGGAEVHEDGGAEAPEEGDIETLERGNFSNSRSFIVICICISCPIVTGFFSYVSDSKCDNQTTEQGIAEPCKGDPVKNRGELDDSQASTSGRGELDNSQASTSGQQKTASGSKVCVTCFGYIHSVYSTSFYLILQLFPSLTQD